MKQKKQNTTQNKLKKLFENLPIQKYTVYGHSMMPLYPPNTQLLVSTIPYYIKKPSLNDVVIARIRNQYIVKRITKLKENKFFLEGDNKRDSHDSNSFGYVDRKSIIGKVIMKITP